MHQRVVIATKIAPEHYQSNANTFSKVLNEMQVIDQLTLFFSDEYLTTQVEGIKLTILKHPEVLPGDEGAPYTVYSPCFDIDTQR
jgi:hypothetical protein